ncbi:hypothetical protein BDB01DRAFT_478796 [Pilobolus umbonatus]|nr:hypothetical protein BDB01DRAFT_478796 [Pilobolus umbonatus]
MNCGNGSMDWYNLVKVRMNRSCDCTYSIAPINIFDICIEPAIDQLTSTIYTSTVNPFVFGKYKASHIIIMESFMKLKCSNTYDQAFIRFKKKLNHEQKYYRHITIHWIKDDIFTILHKGMTSIAKNPLGGLLEQVASGSYFVAFDEKSRYYKNKWITLDENHSRVIIEEQSNIKDYFRDEGEFFIHFFDEDEVEASKLVANKNLNNLILTF